MGSRGRFPHPARQRGQRRSRLLAEQAFEVLAVIHRLLASSADHEGDPVEWEARWLHPCVGVVRAVARDGANQSDGNELRMAAWAPELRSSVPRPGKG